MKKIVGIIALIGALATLGNYFYTNATKPSCTYEYGINGNAIKFEQACKDLKDQNSHLWKEQEEKIVEAKKQQSVHNESSNAIREIQDKVAMEINKIKQQDNYAFHKAEK